jgi:hypothetical protein
MEDDPATDLPSAAAADLAVVLPPADPSPAGPSDDPHAAAPAPAPCAAAPPPAPGVACGGRSATERGLEARDHVTVDVGADGEETYAIDFDADGGATHTPAPPTPGGEGGGGAGTDGSVHYTRTEVGWTFLRVTHAAPPPAPAAPATPSERVPPTRADAA